MLGAAAAFLLLFSAPMAFVFLAFCLLPFSSFSSPVYFSKLSYSSIAFLLVVVASLKLLFRRTCETQESPGTMPSLSIPLLNP